MGSPFGSLETIYYELLHSYESQYNRPLSILPPDKVDFFIPIFGKVEVESPLLKIILLPLLQRLIEIKQLAHTYLYLAGATHSRYEHSLGVMKLSSALLKLISERLKGIKGLNINEDDELILSIAAVLHDLGHSGWGHALDSIMGKFLSYCQEALGGRQFYLFDIRKLDIAITLYLIEKNEQLKQALDALAETLKRRIPPALLREIISIIIAEEWDVTPSNIGEIEKTEQDQLIKKIRLFQTILGAPKGIGGINADRLDWLVRDAHHTQVEVYVPRIKKDLESLRETLDKILKGTDQSLVEIQKENKNIIAKLSEEITTKINSLRRTLYREVYEGLPRAFMDSLLTRLSYAALEVLYHVGKISTGPEVLLRVLVSYLLQPDAKLREYTLNILRYARDIGLSWYGIEELEEKFIKRTSNLIDYLNNIHIIIHRLRTTKPMQLLLELFNLTIPYVDDIIITIRGTTKHINIILIDCNIYAELIKRYATERHLHPAHIYHELIWRPRMDPIGSFKTIQLETQLRQYGEDVYLLTNYYAFRKMDDTYQEQKPKTTKDAIKLIKDLKQEPIIFIIHESEIKPTTKRTKTIAEHAIRYLSTTIKDTLTRHLRHHLT
ncbi:MAG: hypothetical protein DRJ47_10430 [Thermoprotei archaeon]|nr:MAG: hypothetical protein DRJ47_10430 [Thermoprotei archaeon]